ncbi:TRAP transporter large permease [Bradyrhizobium manausense]|uniref:TRAP transporter large permease n=1 Tax=Bradyrhizobium manausense TaxID=989370 RepID=UPI001BA5EAFC|nr:TRAP transporter large permease [Bradyrhizobium manausense]MBR0722623.1 TRAP transporter large permease [Bradyrhizobium manausense]
MSPGLQLIVAFTVFLSLLGLGMQVPFAIAIPAAVYLFMQNGFDAFNGLGLVSWGSMDSFTLTAIPLFILLAEILQKSGLSFRIYRGLSVLVARIPGGLLQTNIAGCAVFAAISGSSIATAASIGSVALPQLGQRKYDRRLSAGSLAAGGTLGILFPPSIAMIVYGTFSETSVAKLFMAGVIPGLILTAMFMIYIAVYTTIKPSAAPVEVLTRSVAGVLGALTDVLPFAVLIGVILGSIYSGLATPTEAAAIGCLFGIAISAIWGELTWPKFVAAMHRTVEVVGNILFIVYAAFLFSYAISYAGVGDDVTAFVVGLHLSKVEFFLAIFVLYTVLGCLVESLGMIVITVPLLYPILAQYGVDPIWFGVMLVMFIELGQISPPIGINLFVIQSIWDGKLSEVVMGTVPFHLIMLILLFMLAIWPELALFLPTRMG